MPESRPEQTTPALTCYRHTDRPTGIRCTRCDRPICPDCMRSASVGFQCPDCVREGQASVRRPKRTTGVRLTAARLGLVTSTLIALNVAVYLVTVVTSLPNGGGLMRNFASPVFLDGLLQPFAVLLGGEYWRLLTSGFLHYGLLHLAMNMLALVVLGRDIEAYLGRARYLALFLIAMLGGGVAVVLFENPATQTVGASGGVFGLLGAAVVILRRRKADLRPLATLIGLNVVISFLPGISLLGHLGGALGGALASYVLVYAPRGKTSWQVAGLAALTLGLLALVAVRVATLG
ncbi:rhomboid family intramembrane serine protease [soil metagenome]